MRPQVGLLFVLIFFIYGCATTGANKEDGLDRSERVLASMETVYEDIKTTIQEVEAVESSLNDVTRAGQSDVRSAFDSYTENVNELENNGNRLWENIEEMDEHAEVYFSGWENDGEEYNNARLQEMSSQRRTELQNTYSDVKEARSDVRRDLFDFISDTQEIRAYLSNDLTSSGIENVSPLADDVAAGSDILIESLQEMQTALEDAISEMARRGN